jgi:hypothetical protein
MPTVSQPKNLGDLLKYEAPNLYSRDQDTVAAAQNLRWAPWWAAKRPTPSSRPSTRAPLGRHGNRRGVLGNDVDATLIDREDAILIARHAIVARGALVWPTGITAAHKGGCHQATRAWQSWCAIAPDPVPTIRFTPPENPPLAGFVISGDPKCRTLLKTPASRWPA